ncbi:MAG: hypothetical protein MJ085_04300 [Clostridia bacterium]|nr:hypothetical protein [Clostridia bacterium]
MDAFLILLVLGINFALSWLNARNVGMYWTESKQIRGGFRAYVLCGYILAIAGFTMVYDFVLMLIFNAILRGSDANPQTIAQLRDLNHSLLIIFSLFTILPTGFFVTGFTTKGAFVKRTTSYFLNAGWDSFAQIHNTVTISRNAPSAIGKVFGFFFGKDRDSDDSDDVKSKIVGFVAVLILILALLGGYFTASAIMKKADRECDGFKDVQQNDPKFGNKRAKAAVNAAMKQGGTYNTKQ